VRVGTTTPQTITLSELILWPTALEPGGVLHNALSDRLHLDAPLDALFRREAVAVLEKDNALSAEHAALGAKLLDPGHEALDGELIHRSNAHQWEGESRRTPAPG
jgi:hypothetical protein